MHEALRPAFADKTPAREPTLKEALMEAVLAEQIESAFSFSDEWAGPGDTRDIALHRKALATREALYAAFARHGIDKALVDKIGRVL